MDSKLIIEAVEVHKPVVKRFTKRKIVTLAIDDLWAADLVIMNKYSSENRGFNYMLNVIDTFSKYAWSEPLKKKSGLDVVGAFEAIIKRAKAVGHNTPNLLHTDKGREFVNKDFKRLLQKYAIKMYHTENEEKSAIIERFNRTLNEKMKVVFEIQKSFNWIDSLQNILYQYNNKFHSTIRMKPADITLDNEQAIRNLYANSYRVQPFSPKFKVGDRVRITIKKDVFANKYRRNWTREIFTVLRVLNTCPVTYRIADKNGEEILGSFYERELQQSVL